MCLKTKVTDYINACFTGLWIQTQEPDEAEKELRQLAHEKTQQADQDPTGETGPWALCNWDIARGWASIYPQQTVKDENGEDKPISPQYQDAGDPQAPLNVLPQIAPAGTDQTTIMLLHNYHRFLNNPMVMQKTFNMLLEGKIRRAILVILSPVVNIPQELEKVFVVIDHDLPSKAKLKEIGQEMEEDPVHVPDTVLDAAAGLTHYEAEGAFALSLARHSKLQPDEVWELKESMLKKSGLLTMHRGKETFADLGGLDGIKTFCKQALAAWTPTKRKGATSSNKPQPRGVLILGVPGTGKSAFAKALGNEIGRPTLLADPASWKGSLVGETGQKTRQALKIADAMSPCIFFIDEIEKAMAGATSEHQGDSGVSADQLGAFLTWLNDHTTDVFVIATSNDISKLPPEFTRAERWDATFFIDLPSEEERALIWGQYLNHYNIPETIQAIPPASHFWTGAEIKSCCRLAALLETDLTTAARNIVSIHKSAGQKVSALREWASGRCLSASTGSVYHHNEQSASPSKTRRNITR